MNYILKVTNKEIKMYIKIKKGNSTYGGRRLHYYKCSEFILLNLYILDIRICPNKEIYDNLPNAG